MRVYYTSAVVCATLSAVAAVCSHNHPNAPLIAVALALAGAGMLWRHRSISKMAAGRADLR